MPYKPTTTQCVVRLVALRGLSAAQLSQCQTVRAEAGHHWTDLVTVLTQRRTEGRWRDAGEREQATTGGQYPLHSQSVQALCQKRDSPVETASALRRRKVADT